jgi:hypothetical protein
MSCFKNGVTFCAGENFTDVELDYDERSEGQPFNAERFFKRCHFFEKYLPAKEYVLGAKYEKDYGRGKRNYKLCRATIYLPIESTRRKEVMPDYFIIDRKNCPKQQFIFAHEVLTKQEREALMPYCPCPLCRGEYEWYICCGACSGCLAFAMETQESIDEARAYREKLHGKLPPKLPRWYVLQFLKVSFYFLLFVFVFCAIYYAPRN